MRLYPKIFGVRRMWFKKKLSVLRGVILESDIPYRDSTKERVIKNRAFYAHCTNVSELNLRYCACSDYQGLAVEAQHDEVAEQVLTNDQIGVQLCAITHLCTGVAGIC